MLALALALVGCAAVAKQGAKKVIPVVGEILLDAGRDAFLAQAVGRDRTDVKPIGDGGSHRGDKAGLYGGSSSETVCDKKQLVAFLTDPANTAKAAEWARVMGIKSAEILGFVTRLTAVTLRFDTLVKNHRFSGGKAVAYDALLPAGMAVLVTEDGVPAVKCNCGNPLGTTATDIDRIDVDIKDPNWKDRYRKDKVRKITPGKKTAPALLLTAIDEAPGTTIDRPKGTGGEGDRAGTRITPEADLLLSVTLTAPGGTYTATASNFRPGETVRFGPKDADAEPYAVADADGTARTQVTTDSDAEPGTTTVHARGTDSGLKATAEVTVEKNGGNEPTDTTPPSTTTSPTTTRSPSTTKSPTAAPGTRAPRLTLSPATVADGGTFTAKASGFRPGELVEILTTGADGGQLVEAEADTAGTATVELTADFGTGTHALEATGLTSGAAAKAKLTVKARPAGATAGRPTHTPVP
ncbi:hypothetical protein OG216_35980 [Streptomycetaceae bacterium NBC_01309]